MAEGTIDEAAQDQLDQPQMRVDWRTGQPMIQQDDLFWQEHNRRRVEQGLGVSLYCAANGLALSTFRHRVSGEKRPRQSSKATAAPSPSTTLERAGMPAFVAVAPPRSAPAAAVVEIALDGMTMRLHGEAADRVLDQVVRRFA